MTLRIIIKQLPDITVDYIFFIIKIYSLFVI